MAFKLMFTHHKCLESLINSSISLCHISEALRSQCASPITHYSPRGITISRSKVGWYIDLIIPFWYASVAYQASLLGPWFACWRDTIKPKYPWQDQTNFQCVPKKSSFKSYLKGMNTYIISLHVLITCHALSTAKGSIVGISRFFEMHSVIKANDKSKRCYVGLFQVLM